MYQNKITLIGEHWLKFLVLIIFIIVFISLLFFLNVGSINAEWNTQTNIEGFRISNATKSFQETLCIYIDNSSLYTEELLSMLSDDFASYKTTTQVIHFFNETNNMKNASFLGIDVKKISYQFYPWASNVEYNIFYYFSTVGNTNYFNGFKTAESIYNHPAVIFNSSDEEQLLNIGDISIQGKFNGFFSKPRMDEMILEKIVTEIVNQVQR